MVAVVIDHENDGAGPDNAHAFLLVLATRLSHPIVRGILGPHRRPLPAGARKAILRT
jgi:hypothetical protein